MKPSEKLLWALSDLDDSYVLSVIPRVRRPKQNSWPKILAVAAMAALIIGAVSLVPRQVPSAPEEPVVQIPEAKDPKPEPDLPDSPREETESVLAELPLLNLGSRYVGQEQSLRRASDPAQLLRENQRIPDQVPQTMPVYGNRYPLEESGSPKGWEPNLEANKNALCFFAQKTGMVGSEEEAKEALVNQGTSIVLSNDRGDMAFASPEGDVQLFFSDLIPLPEDCGPQTPDSRKRAVDWVWGEYGTQFIREVPSVLIQPPDVEGDEYFEAFLTFGEKVPASMAPELQGCVELGLRNHALWMVTLYESRLGENLGEYPILTPEEAKAQFFQGYGMTNLWEPPQDPEIAAMGLGYLPMDWFQVHVPFYIFLVPLEQDLYGTVYLPAIRPEYLEDHPWWKFPEAGIPDLHTRLNQAYNPDQVPQEELNLFWEYFRIYPALGAAWEQGFFALSQQGGELALICESPISEEGTLNYQRLCYDRESGTIREEDLRQMNLERYFRELADQGLSQDDNLLRWKAAQPQALERYFVHHFRQGYLKGCAFEDGSAAALEYRTWQDLLEPEPLPEAYCPEESWLYWLEHYYPDTFLDYAMTDFLNGALEGCTEGDGSVGTTEFHLWAKHLGMEDLESPYESPQQYWEEWKSLADTLSARNSRETLLELNMPVTAQYQRLSD